MVDLWCPINQVVTASRLKYSLEKILWFQFWGYSSEQFRTNSLEHEEEVWVKLRDELSDLRQ